MPPFLLREDWGQAMKLFKSIIEHLKRHFGSNPNVNLDELVFLVKPHIIKRDKKYFLHYQIAKTDPFQLLIPIQSKVCKNKAYYYFGYPVSRYYMEKLVERDVALDDFTSFAQSGRIYWLNKNGTEVQLEVKLPEA